jgi:hypothetical protein
MSKKIGLLDVDYKHGKNFYNTKKQIKRKHRLPEDQIQLENYLEG